MSFRHFAAAGVALLVTPACAHGSARWPEPISARAPSGVIAGGELTAEARIATQPVCIGARSWSAGSLGNTILFHVRRIGTKLDVGYFVYWSEERPWGPNVASYTLLPALATDAFYSHFLYIFPGAKDVLFGPGDIEGVGVRFEQGPGGELRVLEGTADDGNHSPVSLTRADLLDAKGRIVLLTDAWSHQLGAHGAAALADSGQLELRCYGAAAIRPMTADVAVAFRLGSEGDPRRASPAWGIPPAEGGAPATSVAGATRQDGEPVDVY